MENFQSIKEPVIKQTMVFKLKRAKGMRNFFNGIRYAMSIVIHGIDTPFIACPVMRRALDAVDNRIAHIDIS
jgi:hypothetical protein